MNLSNNVKLLNDEVTKFNRLMTSEMQRDINREAKEILGKLTIVSITYSSCMYSLS